MNTRSRKRGRATPIYLGTYVTAKYRTNSENEDCVDSLHKGPPYLQGGGLNLRKASIKWITSPIALTESDGSIGYNGLITSNIAWNGVDWSPLGSGLLNSSHSPDHESDGARGWSRFKPGKPVAGLGQAIGEARQLPSIPRLREAVRTARKFGSEVLNLQFGWGPVISDVRKAITMALSQEKALNQLKRDNGKWVRRAGTISNTESVSGQSSGVDSGYPIFTSSHYYYGGSNPGRYDYALTVRRRRWFEAQFRYWIPDIGTYSGDRRALRALWGLNVTPGLVWELTPWSWLIDWFSNIGDVIDNVSLNAADNLVAKWAFNMTHVEYEHRVKSTINIKQYDGNGGIYLEPHEVGVVQTATMKLRNVASPFGFGVELNGLSPKQLMILAALGLSRSPK